MEVKQSEIKFRIKYIKKFVMIEENPNYIF